MLVLSDEAVDYMARELAYTSFLFAMASRNDADEAQRDTVGVLGEVVDAIHAATLAKLIKKDNPGFSEDDELDFATTVDITGRLGTAAAPFISELAALDPNDMEGVSAWLHMRRVELIG